MTERRPQWLSSKASACNARDLGSIPGSGRSPGVGNGNPLRYSCPENPFDRGAWWAAVLGVAKSWTQLSVYVQSQRRGSVWSQRVAGALPSAPGKPFGYWLLGPGEMGEMGRGGPTCSRSSRQPQSLCSSALASVTGCRPAP